MTVAKRLSLDSKRSSKGSTALSVCKTEPDVSKHTTVHSEKKQGIDELPSERKNKLTGVQSTGISSSELVKLKSRSRLSLGAIKDKSCMKGIVNVRNSYKDLYDTEVEDQNKPTKVVESPTCNEVVNGKNVERNESCAVVSDTQLTEVAPAEAASYDNWVACDRYNAWRLLPIGITAADVPEKWWCSKSTWLPGKNYCDVSEDETTQAVREMNFKISSQNHVIGDTYHANSNANSETLPDGWKKNKSRPEGSNSSQVETSHSSMDSRQKRKRPRKNYCDVSEDETTQAVREMNFKIISQNHVIGDTYHTNSNANFDTMPNGWKKNKSRPEGSNSSQKGSLARNKRAPVGSVSSSPLKAFNLDKLSPAAGRTISRKAHAKSSIGPEVPRKLLAREDNMQSRDINASQSQKLGGTVELKR
ncbi:cullin, conserved site-containing protein [Tanacetum coccineum]